MSTRVECQLEQAIASESAAVRSQNVYCVSATYAHHAAKSGYHRLSEHVGQELRVSPWIRALGDTLLRLPTKLAATRSGIREYTRQDCIGELGIALHMLRHRNLTYHFLYGEKSLWRLAGWSGRRGHRVVATFHHPPARYAQHFRSTKHLRSLAHAVVVSTSQLEFMEELVGQDKVSYVPHGVDVEYFQPAERLDSRRPRCLFAGIHLRDLDTLGRVVPAVLNQCGDAEFVLIHPDQRAAEIAAHPRARWVTRLDDVDYKILLRDTDLLVLPLLASTAVNTVLEAMACGVPVVTTDGGVSDYVDSSCGVLCDVGDAMAMIEATVALLKDSQRLTDLAAAARSKALRFSWTNCAAIMQRVYAKL